MIAKAVDLCAVNSLVFVTAVNGLVGTVILFPVGTSELADIEPDGVKVCPVSLTSVILLALLPIKRTVWDDTGLLIFVLVG